MFHPTKVVFSLRQTLLHSTGKGFLKRCKGTKGGQGEEEACKKEIEIKLNFSSKFQIKFNKIQKKIIQIYLIINFIEFMSKLN